MEQPLNQWPQIEEYTDINLYVFPHLKEFIAIDLRWERPRVRVLKTADVFGESFIQQVERGFGQLLREETEYPFAHLIGIPAEVEELIREMGLQAIIEKLNESQEFPESPTISIVIMGGAALAVSDDQIVSNLRAVLGDESGPAYLTSCAGLFRRRITQEREIVSKLELEERKEALKDDSPHFFTIWDSRN